jgi:hypothetical protein
MASLIIDGSIPDFALIAKQFPLISARVLGYIGFTGARLLYRSHFRGQDIQYRPAGTSGSGAPLDRKGRRMVSYSISKNATRVKISSYPMNLFEGGRKLRGGGIDNSRKNIIRGKFKSEYSSQIPALTDTALNNMFENTKEWETKWTHNGRSG